MFQTKKTFTISRREKNKFQSQKLKEEAFKIRPIDRSDAAITYSFNIWTIIMYIVLVSILSYVLYIYTYPWIKKRHYIEKKLKIGHIKKIPDPSTAEMHKVRLAAEELYRRSLYIHMGTKAAKSAHTVPGK